MRRQSAADQYRAQVARDALEQKLAALSARAREATEAAFCLNCRLHPALKPLIAGYVCPACKQVSIAVQGPGGVQARWVQP